MTSSNIQKIVQNNFHLNPWVLSKNTNEIVNTCIQKIYKQVPQSFRNELRKPKIAALRPENKAPIRTFKSQNCEQQQPAKIRPQMPTYPGKKSSRSKVNHNQLMDILKTSTKNNIQISRKMTSAAIAAEPNKKLIKSPNLKIYASRRYGSSASSSRSSLFRRYDEKRRQRQQYPSQLDYVVRSIHSGQFDATFAKYLMPTRNQQLKSDLGSVPDAMRVSSSIQNDLMLIDAAIRNRIAVNDNNPRRNTKKLPCAENCDDGLNMWKHPPPLNKFNNSILSQLLGRPKNSSRSSNRSNRAKLSREHRDYGRYTVGSQMPAKQHSPPDELFTAQHDREKTELHEKHRRNRMKKLGLIKDSPGNSTVEFSKRSAAPLEEAHTDLKGTSRLGSVNKPSVNKHDLQDSDDLCCYTKASPVTTQMEARRRAADYSRTKRALSHFPVVRNTNEILNEEPLESSPNYTATKQLKGKSIVPPKTSELKGGGETSVSSTSTIESSSSNTRLSGPLAMAASQCHASGMGSSKVYTGYRYNRSSYFPSRKY